MQASKCMQNMHCLHTCCARLQSAVHPHLYDMPAGARVLPLAAGLDAKPCGNADCAGAATGCDDSAAEDGAAASAGARCSTSTSNCTVYACHRTAEARIVPATRGFGVHAASCVQRMVLQSSGKLLTWPGQQVPDAIAQRIIVMRRWFLQPAGMPEHRE